MILDPVKLATNMSHHRQERKTQVLVYTVRHTSTRNTNCDRGSHRTVGQNPDVSLTCQPVFSAESCDDSLPLPSMV